MKSILVGVALLLGGTISSHASTYFGIVNPDGSISNAMEATADNAPVPRQCKGCVVLTKQQYDAYVASSSAASLHPEGTDVLSKLSPEERARLLDALSASGVITTDRKAQLARP